MTNARFSITQSRAISDPRVSNAQFRTLAALGTFGDKDGWCFPKLATLGKMLSKTRQAVSKDIQALVEFGYVETYAQYRKDGSRQHNKYRLVFDTEPPQLDVDTPQQHDEAPSTPEVDTPSTPEVDALTPQVNDPEELKEEPPQRSMFGVLAEVAEMDAKLSRSKIGTFASRLEKAGYTPDQIADCYGRRGWWYLNDWRGQKGQPPTLEQIQATIKQATQSYIPPARAETPRFIKLPTGEVVEATV